MQGSQPYQQLVAASFYITMLIYVEAKVQEMLPTMVNNIFQLIMTGAATAIRAYSNVVFKHLVLTRVFTYRIYRNITHTAFIFLKLYAPFFISVCYFE